MELNKELQRNYTEIFISKTSLIILVNITIFLIIIKTSTPSSYLPPTFLFQRGKAHLLINTAANSRRIHSED